ncbi:REDUCED WALL ACETYLATION [Seminavis robusta]|uniref:REDUCED WALL ACETYLATION n=1 Tax=Seminavis robusta TaxID=568900 RepID=A0A9N8EU09_9STRA|nr:REDUCED WALL ACETYLATION [Seminavis robusta]|eukprot:Sro2160_g317070.1 REDUCED WALL ACETYLATION (563) ;mRNA; f:9635-11433
MSSPTNRNTSSQPASSRSIADNTAPVADPLSGSSKDFKPPAAVVDGLSSLNNAIHRFLQRNPLLNQWKSRRAFVSAQGHMLGILLVAIIVNNWPVSYPREDNHSEPMFWFMVLLMGGATAYTLKHKPGTRGVQLLSRAQTEEWKGWMQFIFIMYHYYRNRTIYNEIRVLVSAYVWMTGFGHFLYCDKKQDFSLERMVSMWVRINYFPLMLSLFLNVKLELYYVVPLHTVGFFMTMATCYGAKMIREKQLLGPNFSNSQEKSNVAAIGICLLVHIVFFETPLRGILTWISHEYEFRFSTDKYSAWFGMLSAFLWSRFQSYMQWCYGEDDSGGSSDASTTSSEPDKADVTSPQNKTQKPNKNPQKVQAMQIQRAAGAGLILLWLFGFGMETDKHVYNPRHPYIFWMPMAGWLMLRNSSKYLTELHSTVLEFMGRITLETYVLQFHVFMCRNVQHIPVVIPGSGANGFIILKFANMLVTGACFIGLAFYARQATVVTQNAITELVTDIKKQYGYSDSAAASPEEEQGLVNKPSLTEVVQFSEAPSKDNNDGLFQTPQKDKKDEES